MGWSDSLASRDADETVVGELSAAVAKGSAPEAASGPAMPQRMASLTGLLVTELGRHFFWIISKMISSPAVMVSGAASQFSRPVPPKLEVLSVSLQPKAV